MQNKRRVHEVEQGMRGIYKVGVSGRRTREQAGRSAVFVSVHVLQFFLFTYGMICSVHAENNFTTLCISYILSILSLNIYLCGQFDKEVKHYLQGCSKSKLFQLVRKTGLYLSKRLLDSLWVKRCSNGIQFLRGLTEPSRNVGRCVGNERISRLPQLER